MGSVFNDTLVTWQDWPKDAISDLMIIKSAVGDMAGEFKDTMTPRLVSARRADCAGTSS